MILIYNDVKSMTKIKLIEVLMYKFIEVLY